MFNIIYALSSSFELYSLEHLLPVSIILLLLFIVVALVYSKGIATKRNVGLALSILTLISIVASTLDHYYFYNKDMSMFLANGLPLHLCYSIAPVAVYGFYTLSQRALSFVYLMTMAANLIAIINPELSDGFPSARYFYFFIIHGLNLILGLYSIFIFNIRPKWLDYFIYVIVTHCLVIGSHWVNLMYDSNYNYTLTKPKTSTMLDFAGEWPMYLFLAQATGFVTSFIAFIVMNSSPKSKS